MKILIEIPKKTYIATCNRSMAPPDVKNVVEAIKHGTIVEENTKDIKLQYTDKSGFEFADQPVLRSAT